VPIDGHVKAVNLIPGDQRTASKPAAPGTPAPVARDTPFGAYLILGALVLAIVASALYVMTTNSIEQKKAELARAEQEAGTVERQASSLRAFADFKTLADTRITTVGGLAESRFPWPRALDDVSRALPDDVYVSSLDGTTNSGAGGSSIRGAISAPAIELTGCTSSQASVARMMSGLREIRGVTRVSLSKSEVPEGQEGASDVATALPDPSDAGGSTVEVPCPEGSPPAFDVVVFFERAPVAPGAALNLTGATAGPSGAAGTAPSAAGPTGASGPTAPASTTATTP